MPLNVSKLGFAASFHDLGVEFTGEADDQAIGVCPSCDARKFYVAKSTGVFDCKRCGLKGNLPVFMSWLKENTETADEQFKDLGRFRGIPSSAFRETGFFHDGEQWLLPVFGNGRYPVDIRRYNAEVFKGFRSVSRCKTGLLGFKELLANKQNRSVWVCEGEWDWAALRWLLKKNGKKDVVVGVPGAGTFKDEWAQHFRGMNVILAYDNDQPGLDGAKKAWTKLKEGGATSVKFIAWPENAPKGFDVNDWISHGWAEHREDIKGGVYDNLVKLISEEHPEGASALEADDPDQDWDRGPKPDHIPSWGELLEVWSRYYDMHPDMVDGLAVSLATILSVDIPGDPLWLYLVAPPGGGKTTILNGMKHSPRCVFRSSLTPASLVSGFQSGKDPSLLPKLKGRTGVFKDGTEILTLPPNVRHEIYGVLRGAFDGDVSRTYGNNVERHYTDLHFSLLIGMTPAIHAENTSHLGERFLKFHMDARVNIAQQMTQIYKAVDQVLGTVSEDTEPLTESMNAFLWQRINAVPQISKTFVDRVVHTSRLIARLRTRVDREVYGEREVRVRPQAEVGTRLAKQLTKLALALAFVYGKGHVDEEVWRVVRRVAADTAYGFHLDIISTLVEEGGRAKKDTLTERMAMPASTVTARLADLMVMHVVKKENESNRKVGRPSIVYVLDPEVMAMWHRAGFGEVQPKDIIPQKTTSTKRSVIRIPIRRSS